MVIYSYKQERSMIMKKYLTLVLLLSFLLIGILSACDDGGESESNESTTNESVSETSETNMEEEKEASVDSGFVEVNETYNVNGLDITIENIEITDNKVRVAMTIANNSDTTKTFYPDQ